MDGLYRWHIARGRDDIIGEAGRPELTIIVVDYLLVEGRPDALRDGAVNLAIDDHRVAHAPAILGDDVVEDHFSRVPYRFARSEVEARLTPRTVEIFLKGERVAAHLRASGNRRHTTVPE